MAGAFRALAMPIASTHRKIHVLFGMVDDATSPASPNDSTICSVCIVTRKRRRFTWSAMTPPIWLRNSSGPSCAK